MTRDILHVVMYLKMRKCFERKSSLPRKWYGMLAKTALATQRFERMRGTTIWRLWECLYFLCFPKDSIMNKVSLAIIFRHSGTASSISSRSWCEPGQSGISVRTAKPSTAEGYKIACSLASNECQPDLPHGLNLRRQTNSTSKTQAFGIPHQVQ